MGRTTLINHIITCKNSNVKSDRENEKIPIVLKALVLGWVHRVWKGRNWSRIGQRGELGCNVSSSKASVDILRTLMLG